MSASDLLSSAGFTPDIIAVYLTLLHPPTADGFNIFERDLRINLHDTVHCRIGGDMCLVTSAEVPSFSFIMALSTRSGQIGKKKAEII